MGLFSKTPKPNPKLIVEGVEIAFDRAGEWWEFTYRGVAFCSYEPTLSLPAKAELDAVLDTVADLKTEIRGRLAKGLAEWGEARPDDGESYSIDLQEYATDRSFALLCSGGAGWGDLGVEFTIKDRVIVDEFWGD